MRLTASQLQRIGELVLVKWKKNGVVTMKADDHAVVARAVKAMSDELQKESALEMEVNKMLDQLERSNSGEFQRFKMFPLLKQKLTVSKSLSITAGSVFK